MVDEEVSILLLVFIKYHVTGDVLLAVASSVVYTSMIIIFSFDNVQ